MNHHSRMVYQHISMYYLISSSIQILYQDYLDVSKTLFCILHPSFVNYMEFIKTVFLISEEYKEFNYGLSKEAIHSMLYYLETKTQVWIVEVVGRSRPPSINSYPS